MLRAVSLALVLLAASGGAFGARSSGLRGTAVRGPTMPVCKVGTPCSAPAAHVVLVFRRNGRTARTRTDGRGRYRVVLAPGTWQVSLASRRAGFGVVPRSVRVVAGRVREVRFSIDTGIR